MLSDADRASMMATMQAIKNDRPQLITIRRGRTTTLAPQSVRIARSGQAGSTSSDAGGLQAGVSVVTILGATTLDIQAGDRFTVDSVLYEVIAVQPNRDIKISAEARSVQ